MSIEIKKQYDLVDYDDAVNFMKLRVGEISKNSQEELIWFLNHDHIYTQGTSAKENEIIKATVTEITKNFVVVDCKAKMEGMIPIEEFKHDKEFDKLKVGSAVEVYLERIESFKGEIVISRDKAKRMVAWKRMEKIFESQEEVTGFITGKVKGGYVCTVDGLPTFMPSSQIDVRPLKKVDHLESQWFFQGILLVLFYHNPQDRLLLRVRLEQF